MRNQALFNFKGKTAVFIDYANIKAWAKDKNYFIDLKILYDILKNSSVNKIIFYYGTDPKNPMSSVFLNKLRSFGYEVITKQVKYLKINLLDLLNKKENKELLKRLSPKTSKILFTEIKELEKKRITLLSPKANFDIEITLDIILFLDNYDNFILFSGDGDFVPVLKLLRSKNKTVTIVSGRKFLAGELIKVVNRFMTLERLSLKANGLFLKAKPARGGS